MDTSHIELDRLFKDRHGKAYLNRKYLDDVTVSMSEPTKTITQVKKECMKRKLQQYLIHLILVAITMFYTPITLFLIVFIRITNIFKKDNPA